MVDKITEALHHPDIPAPITVRTHPRARRVSLRFKPASREVVLTLPRRAPLAKGMAFLEKKKVWLQQVIHKHPEPKPLREGSVVTILGTDYTLRHKPGRGTVEVHGNDILIAGAPEFFERRFHDWLKKYLLAYITPRAHTMAERIKKRIVRITVRNTETLWGSCSRSGNLSFSLRLAFASPEAVDYIIAHEVAHLTHMNHGQRFWKLVETLYPDYKTQRDWLRDHGYKLG